MAARTSFLILMNSWLLRRWTYIITSWWRKKERAKKRVKVSCLSGVWPYFLRGLKIIVGAEPLDPLTFHTLEFNRLLLLLSIPWTSFVSFLLTKALRSHKQGWLTANLHYSYWAERTSFFFKCVYLKKCIYLSTGKLLSSKSHNV